MHLFIKARKGVESATGRLYVKISKPFVTVKQGWCGSYGHPSRHRGLARGLIYMLSDVATSCSLEGDVNGIPCSLACPRRPWLRGMGGGLRISFYGLRGRARSRVAWRADHRLEHRQVRDHRGEWLRRGLAR